MNLKELKILVDRYYDRCERYHNDPESIKVGIQIETINSIGGTPIVSPSNAYVGFDWDANKFIITPSEKLQKVDIDNLEKLREEARQIGWDVYSFNNQKNEIKRLKKQIEELKGKLNE